jgi:hypothetical protein
VADSTAVRFVLQQPQLERIHRDFDEARELADGDEVEYIVVVGGEKGCLSFNQIQTMEAFHEAIDCVHSVITTIQWLRRIDVKTRRMIPRPLSKMSSDTFDKVGTRSHSSWLLRLTLDALIGFH